MSDFKEFAKAAEDNLKTLVLGDLKDYSQEALQDGKAFLERAREDLERWLKLAAAGQLSPDDLAWLIKGKKDLAELQALKQAGVSVARLNSFKDDLIALAISTASAAATQALDRLSQPGRTS